MRLLSLKPGDRVVSKRKHFSLKNKGTLLDRFDPIAWRVTLNRSWVPYPLNPNESDTSWGRTVPVDASTIRYAATKLVLLGDIDFDKLLPVLWDFGKVFWEPTYYLRKVLKERGAR